MIKQTPHGFYVIENDTHIGKWAEEAGRLDHDQNMLPLILSEINDGDVVIDAGAYIGDHTLAYAKKVGKHGAVYAFEANHQAFECLSRNMRYYGLNHVKCFLTPLGSGKEVVDVAMFQGNYGMSYLKGGSIPTKTLDSMMNVFIEQPVDFIKMDCEGFEPNILDGAINLIKHSRPKMLIEVNRGALARYGYTPESIMDRVIALDYSIENIYREQPLFGEQFDILCRPL